MVTLAVEITDTMKKYVDRKIQSGDFRDSSAVVQALFNAALRAEARNQIDEKLLEAVDQIERGEFAPWQPGEGRRLLQEMTRQRAVNGTT
jgi:Arc/MetJ-type ribon-helix-helix transcriptional regulator